MDFLKKAAAAASSGSSKPNTAAEQPPQQQPEQQGGDAQTQAQPSGEKQDYGDKAFDMINKKAGFNLGRDTQEKITDGARSAYEKYSGKPVDPKYSN
ncbi:hypothetical protein E4U22_003555 [Claviceps purpurea]|nr:hypothetical protein E4U28_002208 [Claviceps purpurea]KAG6145680.1 hypothetical protein E4U38_004874 [Claviceps purpurea]KAG6148049.1 hypothetical protein E4U37_007638 [Claviceps purpurea]KAG6172203.1 hypothetical protein E4U11_005930 [Claviceps purpurea]KAG6193155.1 hypothetical protein E4U27_000639 [Claviceps purpurea]